MHSVNGIVEELSYGNYEIIVHVYECLESDERRK